jgi:hypothetical protein
MEKVGRDASFSSQNQQLGLGVLPEILLGDWTKREQKLIGILYLLTFGARRSKAAIPTQQFFVELSGFHKSDVSRTLRGLIKKKVFEVVREGVYAFHPFWGGLSREQTVLLNFLRRVDPDSDQLPLFPPTLADALRGLELVGDSPTPGALVGVSPTWGGAVGVSPTSELVIRQLPVGVSPTWGAPGGPVGDSPTSELVIRQLAVGDSPTPTVAPGAGVGELPTAGGQVADLTKAAPYDLKAAAAQLHMDLDAGVPIPEHIGVGTKSGIASYSSVHEESLAKGPVSNVRQAGSAGFSTIASRPRHDVATVLLQLQEMLSPYGQWGPLFRQWWTELTERDPDYVVLLMRAAKLANPAKLGGWMYRKAVGDRKKEPLKSIFRDR